ncbi:MAG TPA: hypothetical protein VK203_08805 [Nostocaceae cyanobacterium]|nr:hypothetical protein [Nostocaceae cyanobacterium]
MNPSDKLEIEQIVQELQALPLFHFSLSSKELFHSNFLAWICQLYPNILGKVFADSLNNNQATCEIDHVCREHQNSDLKIKYTHGETLVIENKVKSLPYLHQLREYSLKNPDANFILLSLIEPTSVEFDYNQESQQIIIPDKPFIWHYLSYGDLAQKLETILLEIFRENNYHGQLLDEYIQFIKYLHALQSFFQINDPENTLFCNGNIDKLREIRFHDVMTKSWYSQLTKLLKQRLKAEKFDINRNWEEIKKGEITVNSDMINGKGYCEFYYCIKNRTSCLNNGQEIGGTIILGIQIDYYDVKVSWGYWHDKIKGRSIAEKLFNEKIWFDLSLIPGDAQEYPIRKDKIFNQFDQGSFLYRSKRLENTITVNELIDLMMKYLYIIQEREREIEAVIEEVLISESGR